MSTDNPAAQLASDISSLQGELNSLQGKVRLASQRDALEDLTTTVHGLASRVSALRARGFAFGKELEQKATAWVEQWRELRASVQQQIDAQATQLEYELRLIESQMTQLVAWSSNPDMANPLVAQIKALTSALNSKVDAVANTITGSYNSFKSELDKVTSYLQKIEWMYKQLDEATFKLRPTESGIMAVEAAWYQQVKKKVDTDPDGVLYLTDQRLILEQKEEVATKKVLFITTAKEKVQKVVLEAPLDKIEKVDSIDKGLFGHEDHLEVHFGSGVPTRMAHFHLKGQDNEEWKRLIGRAQAHEFDGDRAIAIEQTAVDKVKAAPTKCPTCGGPITQTVTRGMDSIKCDFCGAVIRL
jgi:chromosome segregation ATPase